MGGGATLTGGLMKRGRDVDDDGGFLEEQEEGSRFFLIGRRLLLDLLVTLEETISGSTCTVRLRNALAAAFVPLRILCLIFTLPM